MNTFYVSTTGCDSSLGSSAKPFATIERAVGAARAAGSGARIVLKSGSYYLQKTLRLGRKDSGLSIDAAPGAKVSVSGFRRVSGWRLEKNGLWSARVPWVTTREKGFREIFVGGEPRPRACWPKGENNFFKAAVLTKPDDVSWDVWTHNTLRSRIEIAKGDLDPSLDYSSGEVVFYHCWVDSHVLPTRVVEEDNKAFIDLEFPLKRTPSDFIYKVFNLRESITVPGEWAFDYKTRRLWYMPKKGENMARAKVEVPALRRLLDIDGACNVTFKGISFAGSQYDLPHGERNDMQGSYVVDYAVSMKDARNCRFESCRFEHLAGFALGIREGTRGCAVSRCVFAHLGAGGIIINAGTRYWRGSHKNNPLTDISVPDPRRRISGNSIADCEIADYGRDFPSACGIFLLDAEKTEIHHNHIHDGYYTGISCGWTWGYLPNVCFGNDIAFNHIHHIGKGLLSDMGGIYTLGLSTGTRVRNNLIHDIDARYYGGWGIYPDEGSTGVLIENNIVFGTKYACFHMHYGQNCIVRNNIFAGGRIDQLARTRREAHISFAFYNNIIYWREGKLHSGNWDDHEDYEFRFHPDRTRNLRKTTECDWNIYWNPTLRLKEAKFGPDLTWDDWRARGQDVHSIWADPRFADASSFDFTLSPASPALKLGFIPIDISSVGPRPLGKS